MLLEELIDQLPDGSTIGYAPGESAEVNDIVHPGWATVRAIAAPQERVRIEPEAGSVIVAERVAADEGVQSSRSDDDTSTAHRVERGTSRLDPGNQPRRSGGAAPTGVAWVSHLDSVAQEGKEGTAGVASGAAMGAE